MSVARRAPTLRRILVTITALTTVMVLAITALMVTMTTYHQRVTANLVSSVESVRLAEEVELDLLLHTRATVPGARQNLEDSLRRSLLDAGRYVTTPEEEALLRRAQLQAELYFAASRDARSSAPGVGALTDATYDALEALVDANVAQSQEAYRTASRWDTVAKALGAGFSVSLLAIAGWLLWWLKARAFSPVLALAQVMDRFAGGDHDARATEAGPAELRDMARRFNDMAAALAAQREAQIAFTGGVAHDLRNPLSALKMAAALVRPDNTIPPERQVMRALDMISRQIKRMERMIGDFLDMASIEAGRLELRAEEQDARDLVRRVVELFDSTSAKHDLNVCMPETAVPLRCDPLRIEQVVTNLVSNAIKYSPEGGAVDVSLRLAAEETIIEVGDHGIGISDDDQRRLFEPFRRLGLSREAIPGVGLGLFVVRRIVEAHGGRIDVESAVGEGSTFRVILPICGELP